MKKKSFISYNESIEILENIINKIELNYKRVPIMEALGFVLAEDIIAKENAPKFATSSLDGYAIKIKNSLENEYLEIETKDNPAGVEELPILNENRAIKTFTGSPMPKNSDTLVPIENVEVRENKLFIIKPVSIGNGVRPIGEEYKIDEVLIPKGTMLNFGEIGVLASLNISYINIYSKPKVAILSTGAELLELGEDAKNRSFSAIRSSNNYTLEALFRQNKAEIIQNEIVTDDKKSIFNSIKNSLSLNPDLLVTTGGVSVGDYDFVEDILKKFNAEIFFSGVKIKPGQHILFAKINNTFVLSLPGFAYSSTVTAILYALPIIKKKLGLKYKNQITEAILSQDFVKRSKKTEFTVCNLELKNGRYYANFHDKKIGTSAILTNMIRSSGLLITNENDESKFHKNQEVKVMFF
jgi:molybdopterin molybdotransferase